MAELRPVRAAQEKVYSLVEGAANVGPSESRATSPADHLRHFTVFLGLLRGDFERYVGEKARLDLAKDGVAYYQIPVYLSDAEYQRFVNDLKALLTTLRKHEPNGSRRRRLVNFVTIPGVAPRGKLSTSGDARRLNR